MKGQISSYYQVCPTINQEKTNLRGVCSRLYYALEKTEIESANYLLDMYAKFFFFNGNYNFSALIMAQWSLLENKARLVFPQAALSLELL